MKANRTFLVNREGGTGRQARVNIRTVANMAAIRREKRNGRDVIVVPSATLPDDVVMNDIMYPAEEIERGFASLSNTPAPLGHPTVNGKFVSARDPEGINRGWVGAWNANVRRENGRVFLDKIIDVEVANRSEGGKAVLNAIEKKEPIHTSTALLCDLEEANGDVEYKFIARNMAFDHDAILLDEDGAATPDQGVGIFVNSKGEEVEVINSAIDTADQDLDWAMESVARALERRERAPLIERLKSALMEAWTGTSERETSANRKDADMDKAQFEELSQKVDTLSESLGKIGETVGEAVANAVKPLVEAQEAALANQKAKEEAEKADLVNKVVKAKLLDEDTAKELTLNALRKMAEKVKPGTAAAMNGALGDTDDDEFSGVDLNAGMEDK
jgi:DNA-binding ferritin-like protein